MNLIEQLFNDFNAKYLEEAKARNIDLGLQTVYTPIDKIEKLANFRFADYITTETRTVGILFNTEFINYFIKELPQDYIKNIKFTFFYDCKFDYEQVKDCIFFSNNKLDIELVSIENIKNLDKVMAGKKFDIIFSNPPYGDSTDASLDLKICESVFNVSEEMIIVQPAGWIDADSSTGKAKTWTEKLGKYIKSVYFLDLNSLMNIKLKTHGAIVYYTKNKIENIIVKDTVKNEEYISDSIHNITKYGKMWLNGVKNLKDFIESNYSDFMPAHAATSATSDFSIRFSRRCGNVGKADFYSPINITGVEKQFVEKSYVAEFANGSKTDICNIVFSFFTNNERLNFVNYWKCKVTRFILSFYKHNIAFIHGKPYKLIPWMDFTQEWNDAKLCKEFGISEELWQYIDNFIPNYYDDYESGFEK